MYIYAALAKFETMTLQNTKIRILKGETENTDTRERSGPLKYNVTSRGLQSDQEIQTPTGKEIPLSRGNTFSREIETKECVRKANLKSFCHFGIILFNFRAQP